MRHWGKKNVNKTQLLELASPIIAKIAKNRRGQKFAYYEGVDVEQEVWVFCLQALERYDQSKATPDISVEKQIEHFLNKHVTNRLKNLMRDKYFRPESDESCTGHARIRMNLINALPIDTCDINRNGTVLGSANQNYDPVSFFIVEEIKELIFLKLSNDLIEPFIDLLGGNKLKKTFEIRLQQEIAEILQEIENGE